MDCVSPWIHSGFPFFNWSPLPAAGEAEWPRPLHGSRPPDPLHPAVGPGALLLPDHRERLQTHRGQDPAARAERGHGERADGQAAVPVGVGHRPAPQGPAVGLQSCREPGRAAVLQREEGAPEPAAEAAAAAAAAAAARASQGGHGQTEAPAGPQEEPQPAEPLPGRLTPGAGSCTRLTGENLSLRFLYLTRRLQNPHWPTLISKLQSCTADVQSDEEVGVGSSHWTGSPAVVSRCCYQVAGTCTNTHAQAHATNTTLILRLITQLETQQWSVISRHIVHLGGGIRIGRLLRRILKKGQKWDGCMLDGELSLSLR